MREAQRDAERASSTTSARARSGNQPTGWVVAPLGEVIREPLRNGHSSKASSDGTGVRTLTLTAVTMGDFSEKNTKMTVADPARVRDLWLEPGDILVERANTPELVGTARLYRGPKHFAIFPDLLIRVRLADGVLPTFVEHALSTESARSVFRQAAQGIAGSMPKIDQDTVERLPLPVAPTAEQHRIVDEVEKQFTRLDAAVASLQRVKANLKRYRASVLKAACEGRLVPTEAELARREGRSFESGEELLKRILKERRARWEAEQLARMKAAGKGSGDDGWTARYSEPALPVSGVLPPSPKRWAVASLEQITSQVRPICYGILMPKENLPSGVPYVKVKDMKGDRIDVQGLHRTHPKIAAAYARASLQAGDVLLAIRGTFGRVAEVPEGLDGANITQDTARLAVASDMDRRWIAWVLRSQTLQHHFETVARGVAVKGVNIGDVRPTPVPVPPLPEQHRIVAEVERRLSVVDELEATVEKNLARCARLRQSILKMAFEGRLVPQDPNDEPASVLLDRIRRERWPEEPRRRGVRRVPRP